MRTLLRLPTLPPVHARALALVTDRGFDPDQYLAIISADPALTIAVLRAANSAASSPMSSIHDARDAIVRLGAREARRVVMSVVLASHLSIGLSRSALDIDALWRHLITSAVVTEALASTGVGGSAFVAGLVHDVGRIAMANGEPYRYHQVVALVHSGADALESEALIFRQTHPTFGAAIAEAWGLPELVIDAVRNHHAPGAHPGVLAEGVCRARQIAASFGVADGLTVPSNTATGTSAATAAQPCDLRADVVKARVDAICSAIVGPIA